MNTIAIGQGSIQRTWTPDIIVRILQTPPEAILIGIPNTVRGVLYTMSSPDFRPQYVKPLEFCAIGSGQGSTAQIRAYADWIIFGVPGNDLVESSGLRDAMSQFVASNGIDDVGGHFPCVKIDRRGIGCLGSSQKFPQSEISLYYNPEKMRWIQENRSAGKAVVLRYPWEIDPVKMKDEIRFNDWRDAVEDFNPARTRKKISRSDTRD